MHPGKSGNTIVEFSRQLYEIKHLPPFVRRVSQGLEGELKRAILAALRARPPRLSVTANLTPARPRTAEAS